jgi:2-methylaconitate cis-trans-isomerase PrpF
VVDAGNPSVFVPGEAVGLGARELVQGEVDGDAVAALVHIRGHVAAQLGLVDDPAEAERVTPALP